MVIDSSDDLLEAQASVIVNTDDETTTAENVVSSQSSEVEQIPVVDVCNINATETEEDEQVAEKWFVTMCLKKVLMTN